jgi:hypothetical protein
LHLPFELTLKKKPDLPQFVHFAISFCSRNY